MCELEDTPEELPEFTLCNNDVKADARAAIVEFDAVKT